MMNGNKVALLLDVTFIDGKVEEVNSAPYSFFLLVGESDHTGTAVMCGCAATIQRNTARQRKVVSNNFRFYWCFLGSVRRDPSHNLSLFTVPFSLCLTSNYAPHWALSPAESGTPHRETHSLPCSSFTLRGKPSQQKQSCLPGCVLELYMGEFGPSQ